MLINWLACCIHYCSCSIYLPAKGEQQTIHFYTLHFGSFTKSISQLRAGFFGIIFPIVHPIAHPLVFYQKKQTKHDQRNLETWSASPLFRFPLTLIACLHYLKKINKAHWSSICTVLKGPLIKVPAIIALLWTDQIVAEWPSHSEMCWTATLFRPNCKASKDDRTLRASSTPIFKTCNKATCNCSLSLWIKALDALKKE